MSHFTSIHMFTHFPRPFNIISKDFFFQFQHVALSSYILLYINITQHNANTSKTMLREKKRGTTHEKLNKTKKGKGTFLLLKYFCAIFIQYIYIKFPYMYRWDRKTCKRFIMNNCRSIIRFYIIIKFLPLFFFQIKIIEINYNKRYLDIHI